MLVIGLAVALALALAPMWHQPGSVYDEGAVLASGAQVLNGAVPGRDFETFYGPGDAWAVAGAFAVGGTNLRSERLLGAAYRALIVAGAALLTLSLGPATALAVGLLLIALLVPAGLDALASFAALAGALTALGLLAQSDRRRGLACAAGVCAGLAALARPDFLPALALASVPLLVGHRGGRRRAYLAGLLPAALAYLVDVALAGASRTTHAVSDLAISEPGRWLPVHVLGSEPGRLLLVAGLSSLAALGLALRIGRRRGGANRSQTSSVAALSLLALGLMPYALSRTDSVHVLIPLIPAAGAAVAAAALAHRRAGPAPGRPWAPALMCAVLAASLFALAPRSVRLPVQRDAEILLGHSHGYPHHIVGVAGRDFMVAPGEAHGIQLILNAAERERHAGARTLFVGPSDLRRTNTDDAYLYYLLDDLRPATRYMQLNPLADNSAGSGLAEDVRRSDLLILSRLWDGWREPNGSGDYGSDAPNRVVASRFCPVLTAPPLELLRRCR